MSTDSSKPTKAANPVDVAVEGLVLRPEVFNTPGPGAVDDGKPNVFSAHAAAAREKADFPLTRDNTFPLLALIPIIGVVLAAGSFLGANVAFGPNVKGYDYALTPPDGEASAGADVDPYSDPKVWIAMGKGEYSTVCASCHQASGDGVPGLYPPLRNSEYVVHGEQRVIAILLHGLVGPLQVNGKSYNGAMPAQGAVKNNKQIAQIASYIRNEWGNTSNVIYDDQVAEIRKQLSTRSGSYTEAEIKAIPQDANLTPSKHGGAAPAAAPPGTASPATAVTAPTAPATPAKN